MKIVKRCSWCSVKHLMDDRGNPLPGNARDPRVLYSDGMCRKAERLANEDLDVAIARARLAAIKTVDTEKQ